MSMSLDSFFGDSRVRGLVSEKVKRKSKRTRNDVSSYLMADFETTTDPDDCRVWAWGYVDINDASYESVKIGLDIDSFMTAMQSLQNITYFHNLKFDGMFILDWLLNNEYVHDKGGPKDEFPKGHFRSLISDTGMFYSITVHWFNGKKTEFRDSLKKLPMPVKRIAKAFGMDESKGEIDYDAYREPGHELTPEEDDYLRRDIIIVAKAMNEILSEGMKKLTVGSDSITEYKNLKTENWFNTTFPVLSYEMDSEIRRAYRGGFTYADDRFKGKLQGSGLVLDVNSLYPSVMYSRLLPYGDPQYFGNEPEPTDRYPLVIFSVTIVAKIKRDKIPCIQIKGSNRFIETEYLKEIKEPTTLFVTNVDWKLYNDHYDITVIEYGGGWRFKGAHSLFDTYIDKWSKIKAESVGGKREISKLHLNSLYGKFATNPNVSSKVPILEKGIVKLKKGEPELRPPIYTAMGVFITAYAREVTVRSAQENYNTFAYADTDSLHLLQDEIPKNIEVHPTKLGAWKFEYAFHKSYYIRAKAYLELQHYKMSGGEKDFSIDGKYENRIAGLPVDISSSLTFDDLRPGTILHGKLGPKTVRGGVILKDVPFELKLS